MNKQQEESLNKAIENIYKEITNHEIDDTDYNYTDKEGDNLVDVFLVDRSQVEIRESNNSGLCLHDLVAHYFNMIDISDYEHKFIKELC